MCTRNYKKSFILKTIDIMTAQQQAVLDIKEDLKRNSRSFIAFNAKLNPIMRRLVREQLKSQSIINPLSSPTPANSQLVAHCFFCKGEIKYNNYDKYYTKQ